MARTIAALALLIACQGASAYDGEIDLDALAVEPESRCAPYDAKRYRYPSDLDRRHVEAHGHPVDRSGRLRRPFLSPYTTWVSFRFVQDMDIEHIVALPEAHDSGLCARPDLWTAVASDMMNVTVAGGHVNRTLKRDRDAAEWMPETNRCWYARTVVAVKQKYRLSVDPAERDALAVEFKDCERFW